MLNVSILYITVTKVTRLQKFSTKSHARKILMKKLGRCDLCFNQNLFRGNYGLSVKLWNVCKIANIIYTIFLQSLKINALHFVKNVYTA